jgi:hypothetical protein
MNVGDDSDRLYTFEVAETNEQEESVVTRPGFQVRPAMSCVLFHSDSIP